MTDIIIVLITLMIVGGAVLYIVKEKKKGTRCIGCPAAGNCSAHKGGKNTCSCCQTDTKE